MQYISKRHLVVLIILVVIVGGLLLAGEHFANLVPIKKIDIPTSSLTTTDKEPLIYDVGNPHTQLESKSYVIRPGQSKLTYSEALDLYKDNLLQFNENCQLSTATRSFHLNNEVMIDNRSSKANTFVVGNTLVAIAPYDFAFMILKNSGDAVPVSCGSQKNVATLVVQ